MPSVKTDLCPPHNLSSVKSLNTNAVVMVLWSTGEPMEASLAMMQNLFFTHVEWEVDVTGIDNHELNSLKLVDASARVITQKGPIMLILRQCAYHGIDCTIHSTIQIEHNKNHVDNHSMKAGGTQSIHTHDGHIIPLDIINGLPHIKMSPNANKEWDDLPHVILTCSTSCNGGLCSLLSPKHYDKSDLSSSDSHLTTTSDSKHNKSDNPFAPLSKNFYQAGSD